MSRLGRTAALAAALLVAGTGPEASAQEGPATAAPAGGATAAPTAAPAASPSTTAGRGVVVVALGSGAEEAARGLAREVYGDVALRPSIDEAAAQVLCGGALPDSASPVTRDLAALRAALVPDPGNPATRRALSTLATELGAAAVLAVVATAPASSEAGGAIRARVVMAGGREGAPVELVARIDPGAAPTWPGAAATLRALVAPAAGAAGPAATTSGDRAPGAPAASPPPPAAPGPSPGTAESREFWQRPWFWVALGAFAAAGITALVVTTTTGGDEPSDSVRFRATIPEAQLTF